MNPFVKLGPTFILIFSIGCSNMAWENSNRENSIQSYERFLQRYPNHQYAPESRRKLEFLYFDATKRAGTTDAYERFLYNYPQSQYAQQARTTLDSLYWNEARQRDTKDSYELLIERHPQSPFARNANDQINKLRFYEDINSVHTVSIVSTVTSKLPYGADKGLINRIIQSAAPYGIIIYSTNYHGYTDAILNLAGTIDEGSDTYDYSPHKLRAGTKFDISLELALTRSNEYRHCEVISLNCTPQTIQFGGENKFRNNTDAENAALKRLDYFLSQFFNNLWGSRIQ